MHEALSQVESLEKQDIASTDKADAWQRLLNAYSNDNPFSEEDEAIINKARKQLEYWRNFRARVQPKPDVQDLMQANSAYEVLGVPGLKMVPIPGGSFMMGSNDGEDNEKPVHRVTLSSFSMSSTEVTVGQFRRFVNLTGYKTEAENGGGGWVWTGKWEKKADANWRNPYFEQGDDHPVVRVS